MQGIKKRVKNEERVELEERRSRNTRIRSKLWQKSVNSN